MTPLLTTAFVIGALGSTHCIGMCGPIALSLPPVNDSLFSKFLGGFLYNIGRVITYSLIGFVLGVFGHSFSFIGLQSALSVSLGVLMMFFLFFPFLGRWIGYDHLLSGFYKKIRILISKMFKRNDYGGVFLIGLFNGFLPCGLVYIAIAGAIAAASPIESAFFMAFFGLGTLPLLWAVSFFGHLITLKVRRVFKWTYPVIIFTMACILILRGFGVHMSSLHDNTKPVTSRMTIECGKN